MFPTLLLSVLLASPIVAASSQPRKFEIKARIFRGEDAQPGQFKYMASLRTVKQTFFGEDYNHFCGAALISERWVISGSHCLNEQRLNTSNIRIILGANLYSQDGKVYKVKNIIKHENFDNTSSKNDIALLQTKIRVKFDKFIQPIEIAQEWIEPGGVGIFAGFGVVGAFNKTPFTLQFIKLHVISNDECIKRHITTYKLLVHNSTLCTFVGNGSRTYLGDSGGALVINNRLVGILSWGITNKEKPDQFTRISEFTEWIEEKTGIQAMN